MKRNYQLRCDHYKYFGAGYTQHTNITLRWNSGQSRFTENRVKHNFGGSNGAEANRQPRQAGQR